MKQNWSNNSTACASNVLQKELQGNMVYDFLKFYTIKPEIWLSRTYTHL